MNNTISDHLIAYLLSCRSLTIYRQILWWRLKKRLDTAKQKNFRQNLYRLNKKGAIKINGNLIHLNKKVLTNYTKRNNLVTIKKYPIKTEEILISFDIPEDKKKIREWLRRQIKYWNFKMVQKSLWSGFGPVPKDFKEKLKELGVEKNIKIFKLNKKL